MEWRHCCTLGVSLRTGVVLMALLLALLGCNARPREAVPTALADQAVIAGMPHVRTWAGHPDPVFQQDIAESVLQARRANPKGLVDAEGFVNILAVSGGGADGAYGVGLMTGWSQCATHQRPIFKIVTGVSTGALCAPMFFAGSEWDPVISKLYTSVSTKDISRERSFFELLGNPDSLGSTEPLARKLDEVVTPELLQAVAKGHAEGRRLYVATTNLDAMRLVIWDMGKIASYGTPESAALFRKVMLASASIPVVFPPVEIPVVADGKPYMELHVDGGVCSQVFLLGFTLDLSQALQTAGVEAGSARLRVFVIRNSQLQPPGQPAELRIRAIALRAISGLISNQGLADLYRIYTVASDAGMEFRLAAIPDDFPRTAKEPFDAGEMKRLHDLAYDKAKAGYPWATRPPVVAESILYAPATAPATGPGHR